MTRRRSPSRCAMRRRGHKGSLAPPRAKTCLVLPCSLAIPKRNLSIGLAVSLSAPFVTSAVQDESRLRQNESQACTAVQRPRHHYIDKDTVDRARCSTHIAPPTDPPAARVIETPEGGREGTPHHERPSERVHPSIESSLACVAGVRTSSNYSVDFQTKK